MGRASKRKADRNRGDIDVIRDVIRDSLAVATTAVQHAEDMTEVLLTLVAELQSGVHPSPSDLQVIKEHAGRAQAAYAGFRSRIADSRARISES